MRIKSNNNYINKSSYFRNRQDSESKNEYSCKNFSKPLNNSVQFRGLFNPSQIKKFANKILPSKIADITPVLEQKAQTLLTKKSDNLANMYIGFKDAFIERVKTSEQFRTKLGIDGQTLEKVRQGAVIAIPETNLAQKFIGNIFAPLRIFRDIYSFALNSKVGKWATSKSKFIENLARKNAERVKDNAILSNYKSYTGLLDSIKIWETKQRKIAGVPGWDNQSPLLISDEILESKVMRRWLKSVDPTKGKYQTKHIMLGNRLISGMVYGTFLGNDAYNTTIRYSNDKNEANAQRRSRFAQELAKIGINMYLINLFVGTFEKYVNKSLFHALFMASATTMSAEILGRKLVGRPIFPSDKETLDEMAKKMEEKKGFWVSVGRLISGTKPKPKQPKKTVKKLMVLSEKMPLNKTLTQFDTPSVSSTLKTNSNTTQNFNGSNNKKISFGSSTFFKVPHYMKTSTVQNILNLIKEADPKIYNAYVEIIEKALKRSAQNGEKAKDLATTLATENLIPIGTKKTIKGNLVRSFGSPFFFIKNTTKNIVSGIKKMFSKNNTAESFDAMHEKLLKLKNGNPNIEKDFDEFLNKTLSSKVWTASDLDIDTKKTKILADFLDSKNKDTEEIEGVKNIILYLDKRMKSKDLNPENVEEMKKTLFANFMKTDGAAHVEYDGNTFAMANINLSRAITTLFLIVDAYNLSMQYSNNDKQTAINNGKSRALQEASRITVSAYMLAVFHTLLSKFCNSSLFGAFATTAITSTTNDTLARKVVGVPLGTKTQEELAEIDKENAKSKSPLKRTLAYLIGKRQKSNNSSLPVQSSADNDFSLYITDSFKSMLGG